MIRKILSYLPILFALIMISFGIWMGIGIYRHNNPYVKEGQVWVVRYDKNPFMESRIDTIYILEVKGNYCRYKVHDNEYNNTKKWTVAGAELLKDDK